MDYQDPRAELPELPEGECSEWLHNGVRVNAFPWPSNPVAERTAYERDYWGGPCMRLSYFLSAL